MRHGICQSYKTCTLQHKCMQNILHVSTFIKCIKQLFNAKTKTTVHYTRRRFPYRRTDDASGSLNAILLDTGEG
jgi:hypothetical protein